MSSDITCSICVSCEIRTLGEVTTFVLPPFAKKRTHTLDA